MASTTRPRNMYTEEKLRPAVVGATTLGEVLARLGLDDNPHRRSYLSGRIRTLGIDGGHLRNASILYTDAQVTEAVHGSRSLVDVAMKLGATPVGGTIAHLKRRITGLGLDTGHFDHQEPSATTRPRPTSVGITRVGRRMVIDEGLLRTAVATVRSYAEVIRGLGLEPSGSRHRLVKAEIDRLGLDVSHFLGPAHLRGVPSPRRRAAAQVLVHDPGLRYRADSAKLRRALLEVGVPELCAGCGVGAEWRGMPMTLQIDHVSGDFRDNRRENLRFLCPNCHAVTITYCRKKNIR